MSVALVAVGCNLGDRQAQMDAAVERLRDTPGVVVCRVSRWHETRPVGGPAGQGAFLNGALLLETSLGPEPLRQALVRIENELGRERDIRWQARLLDLDLLLYDQLVLDTPQLVLPHPRMAFRRFVLEPAAEIAPQLVHPLIGWTVADLLRCLNIAWPYVAITGAAGVGKTRLATRLAERFHGALLAPACPPAALAPGRELEREIEFLQRRFELIGEDRFPREAPFAVSDFWFGQSMAYGGLRLPPGELSELRRAAARLGLSVVSPKLRVVLTASAPPAAFQPEAAGAAFEPLQNALRRLASAPGVGPVLEVSSDDEQNALSEVQAAIEAMF